MNVLLITGNDKDELAKCADVLNEIGSVGHMAVVFIDNNFVFSGEAGIQNDVLNDYILCAVPKDFDSQQDVVWKFLQEYSVSLKDTGIIRVIFPVMTVGMQPRYSFVDILGAINNGGFALQDAKAVQFLCGGEHIVGYDLTMGRRKKQLLILKGGNPIIEYNIGQIAEAYVRLGWKVAYCSVGDELFEILRAGVDRLFVINNAGWIANIGEENENAWEQLGIASINYILDHPMYYDDTLSMAPRNGTLLCVDGNHVDYVKRFYPNIGRCMFMPLAGDNWLDGIDNVWKDREIDVLYVGGYKGDLTQSLLPEGGLEILNELFRDMDCTVEEIVERLLREMNPDLKGAQLFQEIIRCKKVDWYIMTYIRVEVIRALIRGGINVTVYGNGWEAFDEYENPHFIYKGSVTQQECLENMKKSKIVLNVMPWFKDGIHDRVINAMLAGAVALTDGSKYLDNV